ncbi:MAG: cysteine dioxygenase family protein [Gaiellales bacterium]
MSAVATWIADRIPANADLAPEELGALACDLRAEESLWRPQVRHDEDERFYVQLYRDPNVDIWLICWVDAQATGYHDHDRSAGGVAICEGVLSEDYFFRGEDGWIREETRTHEPGGYFVFDATYIHGVRHPGGEAPPATSIHCYSPALWRMGHYEPDENGVMRRVSVTYADELLGVA